MTTLSIRACMPAPVPAETSGALLRGADAINRPVTRRRTAPSPHALQAIHIDAALPVGVDRHDASPHRLTLVHSTNARNLTGYQDFVGAARLGLRYVVRTSLFLDMAASRRNMISAVTARPFRKTCRSIARPRASRRWPEAGSITICPATC
jgi:hypothetical protein